MKNGFWEKFISKLSNGKEIGIYGWKDGLPIMETDAGRAVMKKTATSATTFI